MELNHAIRVHLKRTVCAAISRICVSLKSTEAARGDKRVKTAGGEDHTANLENGHPIPIRLAFCGVDDEYGPQVGQPANHHPKEGEGNLRTLWMGIARFKSRQVRHEPREEYHNLLQQQLIQDREGNPKTLVPASQTANPGRG
eukprot:3530473-Pyramimonas_sp.AAC.1